MKGGDVGAEESQDGVCCCLTTTPIPITITIPTTTPIDLGKEPPVEAQLPVPPGAALHNLEHAVRAEAEQVRRLGWCQRAVAADLLWLCGYGLWIESESTINRIAGRTERGRRRTTRVPGGAWAAGRLVLRILMPGLLVAPLHLLLLLPVRLMP